VRKGGKEQGREGGRKGGVYRSYRRGGSEKENTEKYFKVNERETRRERKRARKPTMG